MDDSQNTLTNDDRCVGELQLPYSELEFKVAGDCKSSCDTVPTKIATDISWLEQIN